MDIIKDITNLTGQFLIAVPALQDPNFARTVVLLCRHDAEGAMGIVVNRQLKIGMDEILKGVGLDGRGWEKEPVYYGGPVDPQRGFVLHTAESAYEGSLQVTDGLTLTMTPDVLQQIAAGEGPEKTLVALGCSGWAPGQLEAEILADGWLLAPADPEIIFELPVPKRWEAAVRSLGIDPVQLVPRRGMA